MDPSNYFMAGIPATKLQPILSFCHPEITKISKENSFRISSAVVRQINIQICFIIVNSNIQARDLNIT